MADAVMMGGKSGGGASLISPLSLSFGLIFGSPLSFFQSQIWVCSVFLI